MLADRADGTDEFGRTGSPADLPAGEGERLASAADCDGPLGHARNRGDRHVGMPVVPQVLVGLVGQHDEVALDGDVGDSLEFVGCEDNARRVMRRIEQDQPGAVGDRVAEGVEVGAKRRRPHGHRHSPAMREVDADPVEMSNQGSKTITSSP